MFAYNSRCNLFVMDTSKPAITKGYTFYIHFSVFESFHFKVLIVKSLWAKKKSG